MQQFSIYSQVDKQHKAFRVQAKYELSLNSSVEKPVNDWISHCCCDSCVFYANAVVY